jgi:hypothetical protein
LTELVTRKTVEAGENRREKKRKSRGQPEAKLKKEKLIELDQSPKLSVGQNECPYHFGYLSERSREKETPEECMTCEKLVQCMFKDC